MKKTEVASFQDLVAFDNHATFELTDPGLLEVVSTASLPLVAGAAPHDDVVCGNTVCPGQIACSNNVQCSDVVCNAINVTCPTDKFCIQVLCVE